MASAEFVADLHVHSRFSRATSRDLDLAHLWLWAQRKGVRVVGTGDFTHPGWFAEIERQLVPVEDGLFALREEVAAAMADQVQAACAAPVRFMLTVEISSIYKRDERTRKVHNLICVPDLEAASALNRALARIGNIQSDGRPILGLDSRDLLEIVLGVDPRAVLIPAHIWTPWFSVLGSKSGFDSIEACYADLCGEIFALETGLSSDPPMNWRLSSLDRYCLVSNSDAHSPSKLAREANVFRCEPSYDAIFAALRDPRREGFCGTIEFFPEEGKYHLDGHRKCGCRLTPRQTRARGGRCPACGKPVTLGVLYRVEELADRPEGFRPERPAPYLSLVGLAEVVGEVLGAGPATKGVQRVMAGLLQLAPELELLRRVPLEELARRGGPVLAEAIRRMRAGQLKIEGGYDGEFGRVHLLEADERRRLAGQGALFAGSDLSQPEAVDEIDDEVEPVEPGEQGDDGPLFGGPIAALETGQQPAPPDALATILEGLNPQQRRGATQPGTVIIRAGPGTGKTRTLTRRIACRVAEGADPAQILAVTFTNKAAAEVADRLVQLLGEARARQVRVCTFHALALSMLDGNRRELDEPPLRVLDEDERLELVGELLGESSGPRAPEGRSGMKQPSSRRKLEREVRQLSLALLGVVEPPPLLARYRQALAERGAVDLDSLVPEAVELLEREPATLAAWRERGRTLCVDEYQDVNQAQFRLVQLLSPDGDDLCVIGDADQAIYGFRGADPRYFARFGEDYPGATSLSLERSYRTATTLLEAAQQLIAHNPDRADGKTWSTVTGAPRVVVCRAASAAAEAELVVHSIERLIGGTTLFAVDSGRTEGPAGFAEELADAGELSFGEIAVLFRLGAQAAPLREAFHRSGIPFRCAVDRRRGGPLDPVLAALDDGSESALPEEVRDAPPREGLELLVRTLCPEPDQPAALLLATAFGSQLYGVEPRVAAWGPMVRALAATATETDGVGGRAEAVSLLTLHASKGLEFPVVFIVGCEEGLLPHLLPGDEEPRVAEERRLLYVGMTRAERLLILCHAERRAVHGAIRPREPSRFLGEMAPGLVRRVDLDRRPGRRRSAQLDLF